MNGTSNRGGAYGFTVDSLTKIVDMKGQDGRTTLLDYIIKFCEASHPELLDLQEEFPHIGFVANFPISQLNIDFSEASSKVNPTKKAI